MKKNLLLTGLLIFIFQTIFLAQETAPRSYPIRWKAMSLFLQKKDYQGALELLEKSLQEEMKTPSEKANNYNAMGDIYLALGDFAKARQVLETAISMETEPEKMIWHYLTLIKVDTAESKIDSAFANLEKVIPVRCQQTTRISFGDDRSLMNDQRWTQVTRKCREIFVKAVREKGNNPEMQLIFEEDQAIRLNGMGIDPAKMKPGDLVEMIKQSIKIDKSHQKATKNLLEKKQLHTAQDYRAASFIFQHSGNIKGTKLAQDLAQKAVELSQNPTEKCSNNWILAATTDRLLWLQGRPQIYGTQSRSDKMDLSESNKMEADFLKGKMPKNFVIPSPDTKMTIEPIDPTKITNEQRRAMCVPALPN